LGDSRHFQDTHVAVATDGAIQKHLVHLSPFQVHGAV
jgi:hypothetical protein